MTGPDSGSNGFGLDSSEIAPSAATGPGLEDEPRQKPRQRPARERRLGLQADQIDDRRRQIAEADRVGHNPLSSGRARRNDQERHADFMAVQALAMVKQIVFSQSFAMIGGHDDQGSIEHAASCQFVEQFAQLLVQIGHAIVVGVPRQSSVDRTNIQLVDRLPVVDQEDEIGHSPRLEPEAILGPAGKHVGRMGVIKVEESEKGRAGCGRCASQSRNARSIARRVLSGVHDGKKGREPRFLHGRAERADVESSADEHAQIRNHLQKMVDEPGRPQRHELFENIILVVSEATVQAGFVGTIELVGDESRRRVAMRPQILGQSREVRRAAESATSRRAHGASDR